MLQEQSYSMMQNTGEKRKRWRGWEERSSMEANKPGSVSRDEMEGSSRQQGSGEVTAPQKKQYVDLQC